MAEIVIKVDVPAEFKDRFESALTKVTKEFIRRLEFSIADEFLSKSKLTDEQAHKLTEELKEKVAKRHGL